MRRAALQQAVGEAAGRGADVEAPAPGGVDAGRLERVGELDPAARDEARALVDGELDVLGDELAGLGRALAVAAAQPHLAGHDRRRRAGARREEPALGEQRVEAELGHRTGRERYRWAVKAPYRDEGHTRSCVRGVLCATWSQAAPNASRTVFPQ